MIDLIVNNVEACATDPVEGYDAVPYDLIENDSLRYK